MGGEIFKNSLRSLEAKSNQKFQRIISKESRDNSLSINTNIVNNKLDLDNDNLSQRTRKRENNKFSYNLNLISRISLEKKLLALISFGYTNKLKDSDRNQSNNLLKEQSLDIYSPLKTKTDHKTKHVDAITLQIGSKIKDQMDFKLLILNFATNISDLSINRPEFSTKEISKLSIFSYNINYWFNSKRINLWINAINANIFGNSDWPFDPGILILYNLFIAKMNALFGNLNITFNCDWRTILITANSCRQWLAYFDEQYLENYWHAFHEDERIHIVESIANDYFNTFQHYDYKDAIIMFYINQNLDRIYYFDHTCINVEPYNLPESPDSNTVLKIRFDVIINDPIEFNRLFE